MQVTAILENRQRRKSLVGSNSTPSAEQSQISGILQGMTAKSARVGASPISLAASRSMAGDADLKDAKALLDELSV
jgi:hypothetical protein